MLFDFLQNFVKRHLYKYSTFLTKSWGVCAAALGSVCAWGTASCVSSWHFPESRSPSGLPVTCAVAASGEVILRGAGGPHRWHPGRAGPAALPRVPSAQPAPCSAVPAGAGPRQGDQGRAHHSLTSSPFWGEDWQTHLDVAFLREQQEWGQLTAVASGVAAPPGRQGTGVEEKRGQGWPSGRRLPRAHDFEL